MKTYTKKELQKILALHTKWINQEAGGVRADLIYVNLMGVDLRDVNLRGADLTGADLRGTFLYGANLRGADLTGANLRGADLTGANLRGADLANTNLINIYLLDFIKNDWKQTTPTISKTKINPNAGKLFKVKKTGKIGFFFDYQVFEGWNYGFLDGNKIEFETGEEVKVLG